MIIDFFLSICITISCVNVCIYWNSFSGELKLVTEIYVVLVETFRDLVDRVLGIERNKSIIIDLIAMMNYR